MFMRFLTLAALCFISIVMTVTAKAGSDLMPWLDIPADSLQASGCFRKAAIAEQAASSTSEYSEGWSLYSDNSTDLATILRHRAEKGNANAQNALGVMYLSGRGGVTRNEAQALIWIRKAAKQGDPAAQTNLGFMYENGSGVSRDDEQAVAFYRKAARKGYASALYRLGLMHETGKSIPKDDKKAATCYMLASEQAVAEAQNHLGKMYAEGRGVPRDKDKSAFWLRTAEEMEKQNNISLGARLFGPE